MAKILLLIVFYLLEVQYGGAFSIEQHSPFENSHGSIRDLLLAISRERNFKDLFLYISQLVKQEWCPFMSFIVEQDEFDVILTHYNTTHDYKNVCLGETVVLLCFAAFNSERWQEFYQIDGLRNARHLVYIHAKPSEDLRFKVQVWCAQFFLREVYNVLFLAPGFASTHTIYSCQLSEGTSILVSVNYFNGTADKKTFYENQFLNMHGAAIRTYPDQLLPRSIFYYDKQGQLRLGGYVGKLLTTFAQKRNATLTYQRPIEVGKTIYFDELANDTKNGKLDVTAALTTTMSSTSFLEVTYPLQILEYCFMVPLPNEIPTNEIFTRMFDNYILLGICILTFIYAALFTFSMGKKLNWMDFLFNDNVIRGFLGQPFNLDTVSKNTKFIGLLFCFSILIINTAYQATLQSFLTQHPLGKAVESFDDLESFGLHVLVPRQMIFTIHTYLHQPYIKHRKLFKIVDDYDEYFRIRATLNTHYIYPVSGMVWLLFEEHQKLLERKLFFFSERICLTRQMPQCLPVRKHLPYRDLLDDHIFRIQESGILAHWLSMNFYDLVQLELINLEDIVIKTRRNRPLGLYDFKWIWIIYGISTGLSIFAFAMERIVYYFRR